MDLSRNKIAANAHIDLRQQNTEKLKVRDELRKVVCREVSNKE